MKPILEYLQELKAEILKQLEQVEKHIALETETTSATTIQTTDTSGDRPPTPPPVG